MATNQNHDLENRHVFVAAKTGGGKSQLMRNQLIPRQGIRALFWDVDADHYCTRYSNKGEFLRAVKAAIRKGGPFRIGWNGADGAETFEWFCSVCWEVLNGQKDTWLIMEEMADLDMGQKMPPFLKKLLVRGRKYGAIVITTTQRCQDVPKMLVTQPANKYIGLHDSNDARYLGRNLGLNPDILESLKPLHFMHKSPEGIQETSTPWKKYTPK